MNIYEVNRTHLINAHLTSTTPRETVDMLTDRIGYTAAGAVVVYTADSRKEYYLSLDCIREINAMVEEYYMEVR